MVSVADSADINRGRTVGLHETLRMMPGVQSPLLWGTEAHLRTLFAGAAKIENTPRFFAFRYKSAEHFVDVFRTFYGPTHKAFAALDEAGREALAADLAALVARHDRLGIDGAVAIPADYLEIVGTRAG